jgi:hypothetical protein
MPYKNKPRPYKKEYEQQKSRGEHENRMERQRARREFDKEHGKAKREGKDLAHKKPLSKGGSNKDGYTAQDRSKNRAAGGAISRPKKR